MSQEKVAPATRRREAALSSKFSILMLKEYERAGWVPDVIDSPLLPQPQARRHFGEPVVEVKPFQTTFEGVLRPGRNIKEDIEDTLSSKKGSAIGLELAGTGSRVFSGFTPGFFQRTIGVNLTDTRDSVGPGIKEADSLRNHSVHEGDISEIKTVNEVKQLIGDTKVDLIMERMNGAIDLLRNEPFYLSKAFAGWYDLLSVGGLFIAQIPPAFKPFLPAWKEFIESEHAKDLDVTIDDVAIRVQKLTDEPLPLLPVREALKIEQTIYHS